MTVLNKCGQFQSNWNTLSGEACVVSIVYVVLVNGPFKCLYVLLVLGAVRAGHCGASSAADRDVFRWRELFEGTGQSEEGTRL